MKNKHIDIIVKYFYPVAAGIETNIYQTHKYFLKRGWSVTVHTSKDTLTEKNALKDLEEIDGIKIKRYDYGKFGFFPDIDWRNTNVVSLHNFNIFPHLQIMLYVIWLKILGKKNFIFSLTPHGGFNPDFRIFPRWIGYLKQLYHYTIGTLLINLSLDIVRAVSEWEKIEIIKKGVSKKKVITVINGAEDEAYLDIDKLASKEIKNKVNSYGKYLLQMGRIYMIKNNETAIRALTLLPKDINLVLAGPVGDEQYKASLDALIKDLGLAKRVFFHGVVRGVDKYYLIKHSETMVHMAIWESFCNVVYEALGQGLVPVVANNTALIYLVRNNVNGYTVEDKDYISVAEKIDFVMKNKNSRNMVEMSKRNKEFGLSHSWKKVSEIMEKEYLSRLKKYEK
jgi:glycosyltransferase involved in cell wall biosynthesis